MQRELTDRDEALRQLRTHLHEVMQREMIDCDEALRQLQAHLQHAQDRIKFQVDKKRTDRGLEVGEREFVKLRVHRRQSVVAHINAI